MFTPLAYLSVILIWSTTPLAIAWSAQALGFSFAVLGRMVIGLSICLLLHTVLRQTLPLDRRAQLTYLTGGLGLWASMCCTYWGAQFVPSGLVALVFGFSPLLTSLFAAIWLGERSLSLRKLAGLALAIAGLGVIFQHSLHVDVHHSLGLLAVLAAALAHSLSLVAVKHLGNRCGALATTTGTLCVALPGFVGVWLLDGATFPALVSASPAAIRGLWAVVYLGVFGSVLGFILYYALIRRIATTQVALITLITPVVALVLGHGFNQEPLTPDILLGAACILTGLSLHQGWLQGLLIQVKRAP